MMHNFLKLCNTKNWIFVLLCELEAYFPVTKDISRVLKCLQTTEISMNSANLLKIEVVTLLILYFLGSLMLQILIHIQVKKMVL